MYLSIAVSAASIFQKKANSRVTGGTDEMFGRLR
jgi:hypothetical protein